MGDNSGPPVEWSDIPLLKYLAEVFIQCGAWKNIYEMENEIVLHELFLLYRACSNEFTKSVKASAIGFGAEIDLDDDWYDPVLPEAPKTIQQNDIKFLPIGLGYEAN